MSKQQEGQAGNRPVLTDSTTHSATDSSTATTPSAHTDAGKGGGHGAEAWGEVFSFTLSDGKVSAGSLTLPNGNSVALPTSGGVTYAVSGSEITTTLTTADHVDQLRFGDADGDGLYNVIASSHVHTAAPSTNVLGFGLREAIKVTLDSAATDVLAVSQVRWDGSERVLLSADVVPTNTDWSVSQGLVVETHTLPNGTTHWEVYRDGNADGVYTEVASGTGALIDLVGVIAQTDAVATSL